MAKPHTRSVVVHAPANDTFDFLSSVSSIPTYLPFIRNIEEDTDNHVFGVADMGGNRYEVSGFMRTDPAAHRIDWESDGTPGYRGWLQVSDERDDSRITVQLEVDSATSEAPPPHPGLVGDRIERELDQVLDRIRSQVEQISKEKDPLGS